MDREELEKRVSQIPFWYHRIELPGGIVTPGQAPIAPRIYGVADDLSGKRVLDIGAWDGYWSFEALKRGAREVIAIDDFSDYMGFLDSKSRTAWESFDLCREAFGYSSEICKRIETSVYELSEDRFGRFEVVFLFGTIYHLRYPLLVLDKIAAICDGWLYIESAILDDYSPYRGGFGKGYPDGQIVCEFYPTNQYARNETNWWVPSLHCLGAWCEAADFDKIECWKLTNRPTHLGHCRGHVRALRRDRSPR